MLQYHVKCFPQNIIGLIVPELKERKKIIFKGEISKFCTTSVTKQNKKNNDRFSNTPPIDQQNRVSCPKLTLSVDPYLLYSSNC